jgi:hypothetical protein
MDNPNLSTEELASFEKTKMDLTFFRHGTAWADPLFLVEPLHFSEIRDVFYSFRDNITQTRNLSNLLLNVIAPTVVIERATLNATFELKDRQDSLSELHKRRFVDEKINFDI